MKKSILAFSLLSVSSVAFAQVDSGKINKNLRFCAELRDGILVVVSDQKKITYDITTSEGTVIKANGSVINKGGISTVMKEGECIYTQGLIVRKTNNNEIEKENTGKANVKE